MQVFTDFTLRKKNPNPPREKQFCTGTSYEMASGVPLEAAVVIAIGCDCVSVPKSNASLDLFPYDFSIFRDSQKITRVSRVLRWHWSF